MLSWCCQAKCYESAYLWTCSACGAVKTRPSVDAHTEWVTRLGERLKIVDMEDSHLLNTIRMLRGHPPIGTTYTADPIMRRDWLNAMANEAYRRRLQIDELTEKEYTHE